MRVKGPKGGAAPRKIPALLADGAGGSEFRASATIEGLPPTPVVAPHWHLHERPAGGTPEKRC